MTDRELLEFAAKAAGEITPSWYGNENYLDGVLQRWNPLTDDADALRLAVGLQIDVNHCAGTVIAWLDDVDFVISYENDPYAATRRAIVLAAAEIGKAMP